MANVIKEEKREETLGIVKDAINYMRKNGLRITKVDISRITGLHINTLKQAYIKSYLETVPELTDKKSFNIPREDLIHRIEKLEERLKVSIIANGKLKKENEKLRQKNHLITEKYRYLLGDYIMKIGEPIDHI